MTYSIIALCPREGVMGVAVQSHFFDVGRVVPWAEPGVGVVATQAFADPSYGPLGIALMRGGRSASQTLSALGAGDEHPELRQAAVLDIRGEVAAVTGERCVKHASHEIRPNVSAQANMMTQGTVPGAMLDAYEQTEGSFPARLLGALRAAEREGGDMRGRQSAAMRVVSTAALQAGGHVAVDLRVADDREPLAELERLLLLEGMYKSLGEIIDAWCLAESLPPLGGLDTALATLHLLQRGSPSNREFEFWASVILARVGRWNESRSLLSQAAAAHAGWSEMFDRMSAALLEETRAVSSMPTTSIAPAEGIVADSRL